MKDMEEPLNACHYVKEANEKATFCMIVTIWLPGKGRAMETDAGAGRREGRLGAPEDC